MNAADLALTVSVFPRAKQEGRALGDEWRTTWGDFAGKFNRRWEGEKDGMLFVPARFKPEPNRKVHRVNKKLIARTLIPLDIEANKDTGEIPPAFEATVAAAKARGWAGVVYTSHSHTPDAPRYRVVLPLSREIGHTLPVSEVIAAELGLTGVLDRSKLGTNSPFYFPSSPSGGLAVHRAEAIDGAPIDADWITGKAQALQQEREAERVAAAEEAARRRAERRAQGFNPDDSLIEKLRDHLNLEEELVKHGYAPDDRGRYLFPGSGTGMAGVHILPGRNGIDRVYSHHAADPLAPDNLPDWCGVKAPDVIDVVTILEFEGDRKRALRELARRFGIEGEPPKRRSAQDEFPAEPNSTADDTATDAEPNSATDPEQPGVRLYRHGENPYGNRRWLVDRLLPDQGVALLAGQWSAGKTFAALDLAASVMLGTPFAHRAVDRRGGVLFLAAEGEAEVPIRLDGLVKEKVSPELAAAAGVDANRLPFLWADEVPSLVERNAAGRLAAIATQAAATFAAEELPLALIVVDTMAGAAGWNDENSAAETQNVMRALATLSKRTGALVLAVDHFGKMTDTGVRGSSAKEAAADAVLALLADRRETGKVENRRMVVRKLRGGATGEETPFAVRVVQTGTDTDLRPIETCVIDWSAPSAQPTAQAERDAWPKRLRIFRQALGIALSDEGQNVKPAGADGAEVFAVPLDTVRREFYATYPAEGDTEAKRQAPKRQQFHRNLREAGGAGLIGMREFGGRAWVWLTEAQRDSRDRRDIGHACHGSGSVTDVTAPLEGGCLSRPSVTSQGPDRAGIELQELVGTAGYWRPVRQGETHQPGVHVRMNMTTGRQEVFEPYPPGYDPELEAML